ncbi:hypothetical protein DFP72DRAFT_852651 [Ephemerocybe angulata]|uniref:Uncharacterized protein n=1 Tax=Ephemerocybe angulata TaxID=980116 RepID=A0A8H6M0W9_9AGAR|nr:hypothetical protein DFP72DRAFT_852651 [Tulosesus angulatus]
MTPRGTVTDCGTALGQLLNGCERLERKGAWGIDNLASSRMHYFGKWTQPKISYAELEFKQHPTKKRHRAKTRLHLAYVPQEWTPKIPRREKLRKRDENPDKSEGAKIDTPPNASPMLTVPDKGLNTDPQMTGVGYERGEISLKRLSIVQLFSGISNRPIARTNVRLTGGDAEVLDERANDRYMPCTLHPSAFVIYHPNDRLHPRVDTQKNEPSSNQHPIGKAPNQAPNLPLDPIYQTCKMPNILTGPAPQRKPATVLVEGDRAPKAVGGKDHPTHPSPARMERSIETRQEYKNGEQTKPTPGTPSSP